MIWRTSNPAMPTAAFVTAGVALASLLAWLATAYIPEDDLTSPSFESEPVSAAELEQNVNAVALEQGRVYYAQLCASCHGARGDGQGEWAYRVTPRPASFTSERVRRRSDAQLHRIISEGLPGTSMIGFERQLSDRQLQQVVVYVRHLGGGSGARAVP